MGVSACPLTGNLDTLRRLEAAAASVAVLPSLFEEQIRHDELEIERLYEYQAESFAESLTYFPEFEDYNTGPRDYLKRVETAKRAVSIPIIGSLNGCSPGGWIRYAKDIQNAGADALELNIYFVPTDPQMTAAQVEQRYVNLVAEVCRSVSIPVAVKIGPNFSSLPHFAGRLVAAGAAGLVLFNRYLEADIDLEIACTSSPIWCSAIGTKPACRSAGSPSCATRFEHRWPRPAACIAWRESSSCYWPART